MKATKEEQRGVVRFLTAEGESGTAIYRRLSAVYGDNCMSVARVKEWHKRFREGRTMLKDDFRPGQAHRVITDKLIQRVDDAIRENRRLKEDDIAQLVGVSHGTIHTIIAEHLQYRKICGHWVPNSLLSMQTETPMDLENKKAKSDEETVNEETG